MSGGATGGVEHGIWCQRHSSTGDTLPLPIQDQPKEEEALNGMKMEDGLGRDMDMNR